MPTTILTDRAEQKIALAAGSGSRVAITHVALGDGNGASYIGDFAQTALRRERARLPVESRYQVSPRAWRVKVAFPAETPTFAVREAGFFDEDGDLIALATFPATEVRQTGTIVYLIDHILDFSRVADGLVIVDAPDDELFDHAVANLETQALDVMAQLDTKLYHRDAEEALAARDEAAAQMAPVGMVAPFARLGTPSGWIECDGRAVSRADFAALFAAIGITFGAGDGATTFNVPDLRGEFIRGWDHGRGADPSRRFGSFQADELKEHTHNIQEALVNATYGGGDGYGWDSAADAAGQQDGVFSPTEPTGGAETRPRNIALKFCIRY